MKSISLAALAALLALAGESVADGPEQTTVLRPRYYFPREIKRPVYTNTTLSTRQTTTETRAFPSDLLSLGLGSSSSGSSSSDSSSSGSDGLGSLLGELTGQPPANQPSSSSASNASPVVVPVTIMVLPNGETTTITGTPAPPTATGASTSQTVVATSVAATTTTAPVAEPTATAESSSPGLLGNLGSDLSGLLSPSSSSASSNPASPSNGTATSPTATGTTGGTTVPPTSPSTTSSSSGLDLPGALSSIGGGLVGSTGLIPLGATPSQTSSSGTPGGSSAVSPSVTPSASSTGLDILPTISIPNILSSPTGNSTATPTPSATTIPVVVPTVTPSISIGTPSTPIVPTPTGTPSTPGVSSVPALPTSPSAVSSPFGASNATSVAVTTPSGTPTEAKTTPTVTPTPTPTRTSSSQPTESSDTSTYIPPSSIVIVQPTTTVSGTTSEPTASPTQLPQVISPSGGIPPTPEDSTLIQLGFNSLLPYPFVVNTLNSSSQILFFTPQGLQYALQIPGAQIVMNSIRPYDTTKSLGYITTLVLAYIPSDQVNPLSLELHAPNSRLYQQEDESIRTLFAMLNPEIPLVVGEGDSGSTGTGLNSGGAPGSGSNGGSGSSSSDQGGASNSSSTVRGSSVGIGVGVVAGAAAYGAGMFYIARRYRKKRQGHQRSSSVPNGAMSEAGSGSLLGGRNSRHSGRSNRTQMISAPVMAENSLGWN